MRLEDQVCTFLQAQTLAGLGINARPLFMHIQCGGIGNTMVANTASGIHDEYLPAFTVAELGVMLPIASWSTNSCNIGGFRCSYFDESMYAYASRQDTEAEARADVLIHLLEKKITTAAEINARLSSTIQPSA